MEMANVADADATATVRAAARVRPQVLRPPTDDLPAPDLDPVAAVKAARLRHVSDEAPGISRHKARNGFDYRAAEGDLVRDIETPRRIRALAIPPAWTGVWICASPNGHIQATGRDARGRKQYRYHLRWREVRAETKFGKMLEFARGLPHIRPRRDRSAAPRPAARARAGGDRAVAGADAAPHRQQRIFEG